MTVGSVYISSPMNRHERIRNLRIKLILHSRIARQSSSMKGEHHFDTVYHRDVVEEISAAIANERRLMEMEMDAQMQRKHDGWDIEVDHKCYEL